MKHFGSTGALAALLAFNGGFVDTAGFLGLQGLFTAHVTGNFVTLAAALIEGSNGVVGKILALPEFILVVALARYTGNALRRRGRPVLPTLLSVKVLLLAAFFVMAVASALSPMPTVRRRYSPASPALLQWRCRMPCTVCISPTSHHQP